MNRSLILACSLLALAGCEVAPDNQLNALDMEFCHKEGLETEIVTVGFFVKESKVLCTAPKLTQMERLDFMLWVAKQQSKDQKVKQ